MRRRLSLSLLGLAAVAYAAFAIRAVPVPDHPFTAQPDPLVIAHQGGEALRPSNTRPAFDHAVALGADVLEMDVHATADGVLVLMHDDTVDRTTDGQGAIRNLTFAEIRQLDAGAYWTADGGQTFPYRGQGIRVPSLAEIFQAYPHIRVNIEIKQASPSIVEPFCQLLRQYEMTDQVLVATFHEATIREMRAACPEVATSMVRSEVTRFWILSLLGLGRLFHAPAAALQVPERSTLPLLGEVQVVTPRFVRNAHRHNVAVHVWTIDEAADMERLLAMGVDGLITDRPDRMLALLGRENE